MNDRIMNSQYYHRQILIAIFSSLILSVFFTEPTWAITVAELQAPVAALKNEIFGGWMQVVKICAATSGIIMSVFRGSLTPFGIGAGLTAGIHLYDSYLGTGAAGALI